MIPISEDLRVVAKTPAFEAVMGELGYKKVKHGRNIATEYDDVDEFICSECGLHLENWVSVEVDEDTGEKAYHEFRLRRCPCCGAQIDLTE